MDRVTPNPSESNRGGRGVKTRFHWIVGQGLPEHSAILEAVPGVGNVGKLVVDALAVSYTHLTLPTKDSV